MQATPENQLPQAPNAFPFEQASESAQPQSPYTFPYETPEESSSNTLLLASASIDIPVLPSASADIPAEVSQTGKKPVARLIITVLLLIAVLVGSSLFFFVKSGRSVLPANSHPTATPGVGVPVIRGNWEVTLRRVHQESVLNGMNIGLGGGTYTPNSGYTFLVLDVQLRGLHSQQVTISPNIFALISSDGGTSSPDLVSNKAMPGYSSGVVFMSTSGNEMELSLAFAIPKGSLAQIFKLDFQGIPLISFTTK